MNTAAVVQERYSAAAKVYEPGLCCPASYDPKYLDAIPEEVLERDYGCGDPSRCVRPGEIALDLGSGGGKLCFIASQLLGPEGKIIGVDMNDDMLALARRAAPDVGQRLGYANVEFRKGKIQDLTLDLERIERYLRHSPIRSAEDLELFHEMVDNLRAEAPLVASDSIDVVMSNCVLNLVSPSDKHRVFKEIHRVLKPGGRAVISDVVSDEIIPSHLQANAELWGACYSGAMREDLFVNAFAEAGLYGISVLARDGEPYHVIEGIELRKVTLVAYKGKEGPCWDHKQAVIYKGPFRRVEDDDGHVLVRGQRIAVCKKTFAIYHREPYAEHFECIEPYVPISSDKAEPFTCSGVLRVREPQETKNDGTAQLRRQDSSGESCGRTGCC